MQINAAIGIPLCRFSCGWCAFSYAQLDGAHVVGIDRIQQVIFTWFHMIYKRWQKKTTRRSGSLLLFYHSICVHSTRFDGCHELVSSFFFFSVSQSLTFDEVGKRWKRTSNDQGRHENLSNERNCRPFWPIHRRRPTDAAIKLVPITFIFDWGVIEIE